MPEAVIPSTKRPISSEVLKGTLKNAGLGDWIVPGDEDHYVTHIGLSGAPLNEFDQTSTGDSMTVTIASGEGYVGGAWLARDESTEVTLDSGTSGQMVAVGPRYQVSDALRIDLIANFTAEEDYHILWEFDTDSTGVTATTNHRSVGGTGEIARLDDDETVTGEWTIENASGVNTRNFLLDRDGYGFNFGSGGQNDERPFIAPYQNGGSNFSHEITYDTDHWRIETPLEIGNNNQWAVTSGSEYEIQKNGTDGEGIINFKTN